MNVDISPAPKVNRVVANQKTNGETKAKQKYGRTMDQNTLFITKGYVETRRKANAE